jgi:predicted MFS family arabinose efflux permease
MTRSSLPPAFRALAWSNLAAQSAEQIGLAATPIVAVMALGVGAGETGLLQTAQTLPFLLLTIPAGLLVDRASRRTLMVAAEALRALSLVALLALLVTGAISLWWLAVIGFVGAAGTVAYSVAAPSLVPALVPRPLLGVANGRIELARSTAFALGPALAGALVAWTGGSVAFAGAAALSLLAVLLLSRVREPERGPRPASHPVADLREGAALVFGNPLLRPILFTQVMFNAAFFVLQAVYVPYAVHRLGMEAGTVGLTLGAAGFGMVAGALLAARLMRAMPVGRVITIGPLCGLAASLVMVATIWVRSPVLAGFGFFLIGIGPTIWVISSTTLRQTLTPGPMLGRTTAILATAGSGSRPVGALIGAAVGGTAGPEACLIVSAAIFLVQALIIVASPVPRLAALPEPC